MKREAALPGRPATYASSASDDSSGSGATSRGDARAAAPAFLRKLDAIRESDDGRWLTPCPEHGSSGFTVLIGEDPTQGRYRFTCLDAQGVDVCASEGRLLDLLGLTQDEIRLSGASRLEAVPLTSIRMRSIEWLESPLWQRSAFQLLAAAKGLGKGTYLCGLAARLSNAGANVLFVATEDSTEIDLKPRLVAAGAALERCFTIRQHVRLPDDVGELRQLATGLGGVGLLVIDPVANHIGDRNSNSDAEVRDAIAPLNALADELKCLLVGVRHPGKDRSRGAVASVLGSTAWVDTPRAVVMIARDDEDPQVRHIQVVAGNRSLNGAAQAFRIEAVPVDGLAEPITLAVALGESAKSVEDLIADSTKRRETKTDRARELILDILDTEGAQESDTLDARIARETGLAAKTVRNARVALANEGLVKSSPERDHTHSIVRWHVQRTSAPRPEMSQIPRGDGTWENPRSPTHSDTGPSGVKPNQDGTWESQIPSPRVTGPSLEIGADEAEEDAGPTREDHAALAELFPTDGQHNGTAPDAYLETIVDHDEVTA